jgi:diadenosine tetraphosphatase ApaH/serine/threonine PP2A family protein phosphatase
MRALILSDIHANLEALDAVLAATPPYDVIWNLGDTVGYGASPGEVIERIRMLPNATVRGNHDRATSGLTRLTEFNAIAAQAVLWTRSQLEKEQLQWLKQLPKGPLMVEEGIQCVHGSLLDEDEYVVTLSEAEPVLARTRASITFFGHTHVQGGFATNGKDWFHLRPHYIERNAPEHFQIELRSGARYLLNPGSVGQPRDKDWRAAFALYESDAHVITFYRVPYEVGSTQERIVRAGLPDKLALRLRQGR